MAGHTPVKPFPVSCSDSPTGASWETDSCCVLQRQQAGHRLRTRHPRWEVPSSFARVCAEIHPYNRGVQPSGFPGPPWKENNCLGPQHAHTHDSPSAESRSRPNFHHVFRKLTHVCWAVCPAILGRMRPVGHGLDELGGRLLWSRTCLPFGLGVSHTCGSAVRDFPSIAAEFLSAVFQYADSPFYRVES